MYGFSMKMAGVKRPHSVAFIPYRTYPELQAAKLLRNINGTWFAIAREL